MKRKLRRNNLTLLELVISLAIVAALSVVVLDNFSDVEMRERERQTAERGERVRNLMTGADEKDGVGRFLSDMGRWPKVVAKNDAGGERNHGRNLAQLYDRSVFYHKDEDETAFSRSAGIAVDASILGLPAVPVFSGYAFPTVFMNVGWSGPYLNLLKCDGAPCHDGWGHDWKIVRNYYLKKSGDTLVPEFTVEEEPADGVEIDGIVSYGADDSKGGAAPSDRDQAFLFAHDLTLAALSVTLKVRDDASPSVWRELKNATAAAYVPGNIYDRDEIVFLDDAGARHYYTCAADRVSAPPHNGSFTQANEGWRYGVSGRLVSADGVRVLLFAPARREASGNSVMELGFYRFLPYLAGAGTAERFPALRYLHSGSLHNDADATADGSVDQEVEAGKRNPNRLRAKSGWEYAGMSLPSTFRVEWLTPGKRRIYAFVGFYHGNTFVSGAASSVEQVDLKPGNNDITLHLERIK